MRHRASDKRRQACRPLRLERLEQREPLAVVSLTDGSLYVVGDDADNTISLNEVISWGAVYVEVNADGERSRFDWNDIDKIVIRGRGGNDTLVASGLDRSLTISGGGGADTIVGGRRADTLWGNDGDDSILGGEGNDWLWGNDGDDRMDGGDGGSRNGLALWRIAR